MGKSSPAFRIVVLVLLTVSFPWLSFAQLAYKERDFNPTGKISPLSFNHSAFKIRTSAYGIIFGYQKGRNSFIELGAERHWRKIRLVKPTIFSLGGNMEYNFGNNVLGYKASVWYKIGRIDFTYGGSLCYFTDFNRHRFGISPFIGFRLFSFHLINGYNLTVGNKEFREFNTLFISLRFFLPLDTKIQFKRSHRKKKS